MSRMFHHARYGIKSGVSYLQGYSTPPIFALTFEQDQHAVQSRPVEHNRVMNEGVRSNFAEDFKLSSPTYNAACRLHLRPICGRLNVTPVINYTLSTLVLVVAGAN
jgi:hypothetical protein